jgi:hypothetical protein
LFLIRTFDRNYQRRIDPERGILLMSLNYGCATSGYLNAEVCVNGHPTTDSVEGSPELTAKFCAQCGAVTVRNCVRCNSPIRGHYHIPGVFSTSEYHPPSYCHACGTAFPWTQGKLQAAKELAAEAEGLDDQERNQLQESIDDLAVGGPRVELAASRFRRLTKKAGKTVGDGLYKIVVDVLSETAKKTLLS